MKSFLPAFLFSVFCVSAFGFSPHAKLSAFDHLAHVNREWHKHPEAAPSQVISFQSDQERIAWHLTLVEKYLRSHTPAHFSSTQLKNRNRLLDTLTNYATRGVFPTNTFHKGRKPYFIDIFNVYCAVGYLIKASGHDVLARRISAEHNYDFVADIQTPGLVEWASEHGFSPDELAWIQPAYPDRTALIHYGGGTNGEVTKMRSFFMNNEWRLVVTGHFTKIGDVDCDGAAYYSDGKWHCLGDGLAGTPRFIEQGQGDSIILVGDFTKDNKQYPMAIYSSSNGWEYPDKPYEGHLVGTTIRMEGFAYHITYYLPEENRSEMWEYNYETGFKQVLDIDGIVHDYDRHQYSSFSGARVIYGGAFDTIVRLYDSTVHQSPSLFWVKDPFFSPWYEPVKRRIQDTVYSLYSFGNATYIGGNCQDSVGDYRAYCVYKLVDSNFTGVVSSNQFSKGLGSACPCAVRSLINGVNNSILLGGQFSVTDGMYFGENLGLYFPLTETTAPYGSLDGPVNTLETYNSQIVFGGKFERTGRYNMSLSNLARYYQFPDNANRPEANVRVYPNPTQGIVQIAGLESEVAEIHLVDVKGRTIQMPAHRRQDELIVDLSHVDRGIYVLSITTQEGDLLTQRIAVE